MPTRNPLATLRIGNLEWLQSRYVKSRISFKEVIGLDEFKETGKSIERTNTTPHTYAPVGQLAESTGLSPV